MSKLDYLNDISTIDKCSLWEILGRLKITEKTKYFSEGAIYLIDIPKKELEGTHITTGCPLQHSLIFCEKELILDNDKSLNWYNFNSFPLDKNNFRNKFFAEDVSFGNKIVSSHFKLILPTEQFKEIYNIVQLNENEFEFNLKPDINLNLNMIPFQDLNKPESIKSEVKINDSDYKNCLKCLGYPFITEEELEYSREDILNLAIKPALEEYFHWIPLVEIQEEAITGQPQDIPFPNDAYDVLGVSVQQRGTHGSGNITNTLLRYFDEAAYGSYNYAGMTGTYRGTRRPHTISSPVNNFVTTRALAQATTNLNTRVHFEKITKDDNGTLKNFIRVSSNKLGAYNIHWAIKSLNFDDVEYQQRQNVIKYCQAEIMLLFANLRRQAKSDIPGAIDYSNWIDEAKTMKQEVVTEWKALVKASGIMRGSL